MQKCPAAAWRRLGIVQPRLRWAVELVLVLLLLLLLLLPLLLHWLRAMSACRVQELEREGGDGAGAARPRHIQAARAARNALWLHCPAGTWAAGRPGGMAALLQLQAWQ